MRSHDFRALNDELALFTKLLIFHSLLIRISFTSVSKLLFYLPSTITFSSSFQFIMNQAAATSSTFNKTKTNSFMIEVNSILNIFRMCLDRNKSMPKNLGSLVLKIQDRNRHHAQVEIHQDYERGMQDHERWYESSHTSRQHSLQWLIVRRWRERRKLICIGHSDQRYDKIPNPVETMKRREQYGAPGGHETQDLPPKPKPEPSYGYPDDALDRDLTKKRKASARATSTVQREILTSLSSRRVEVKRSVLMQGRTASAQRCSCRPRYLVSALQTCILTSGIIASDDLHLRSVSELRLWHTLATGRWWWKRHVGGWQSLRCSLPQTVGNVAAEVLWNFDQVGGSSQILKAWWYHTWVSWRGKQGRAQFCGNFRTLLQTTVIVYRSLCFRLHSSVLSHRSSKR